MSIASWTSPRVSSRTLPILGVMSRASASLRSASSCAARNSSSALFGAGASRQFLEARGAASIAPPASAAVDFWNSPINSPVAGLRFSNVSPETDGTHSPSIRLEYMGRRVPYCGHPLQLATKGHGVSGLRNGDGCNLAGSAKPTEPAEAKNPLVFAPIPFRGRGTDPELTGVSDGDG